VLDGRTERAPPEFVYHYTNASGLLGIISKGTLWMTDIEFMNDAEELAYARSSVLDELRVRAYEIAPPDERSVDGDRAQRSGTSPRSWSSPLRGIPQGPITSRHRDRRTWSSGSSLRPVRTNSGLPI
jgi:hypothetical protein